MMILVPAAVLIDVLKKNIKKLSIDDVEKWIEVNDGINGRIEWFESFLQHNNLYQMVAQPLLSMRTTG